MLLSRVSFSSLGLAVRFIVSTLSALARAQAEGSLFVVQLFVF